MIHSFKVGSTLSAYRGVSMLSGTAYAVGYPESNQAPYIGITRNTVLETTGAIEVAGPGEVAPLYFNQAVTTGKLVGLDSNGMGIAFALPDTTTSLSIAGQYIGVLIGPSVAATGTIADVLIRPAFVRVSA
jgi:hypothetical protein